MAVPLCDLASGEARELLRESHVFRLFSWDSEDRVLLEKRNFQTYTFDDPFYNAWDEYWYLNPFTGELTPVTTPTP